MLFDLQLRHVQYFGAKSCIMKLDINQGGGGMRILNQGLEWGGGVQPKAKKNCHLTNFDGGRGH